MNTTPPEVFCAALARLELENQLRESLIALLEPQPDETASEWCERDLPDGRSRLWIPSGQASSPGPFSFAGREYAKVIVDFFSAPGLTDLAACFGSQLGKTVALMAGLSSKMVRDVCAAMWAMPNEKLAKRFSRGRWIPFLRASAALQGYIPTGSNRHLFSILSQRLGSSMLDFIGSNSPANLSSTPVGIAVADEIDKFAVENASEAAALNLLEQRTKDFPEPKRAKTSTPTTVDGPIWQEFLKGNQCRYFCPCPHCGKRVVKAWSKSYTIFKLTGDEAFATWDNEAKVPRGRGWEGVGWDLERVERSARYQCPHCGGHILDGHNTMMVREGLWTPTNPYAPASFISLHLPSLYGSSSLTRVGALAKSFLQGKRGLLGLKGFINGELAEPDEGQGMVAERVEIISPADAPAIAEKMIRFLGCDYQQIRPHWAVCREFDAYGNSRLVEWFTWENFEELRAKQIELGVDDQDVGIDTGHKASEVYEECARHGSRLMVKGDKPGVAKVEWFGWTPMKGRERTAFWPDSSGVKHQFGVTDVPDWPMLQLLQFNGHELKNNFDRMRKGKSTQRCEFNHTADETFWKHLDGETLAPTWKPNLKRYVTEWKPRTQRTAIHLKDCEIEIQALAMRAGVLKLTTSQELKSAGK
jgi:hypothetical protein